MTQTTQNNDAAGLRVDKWLWYARFFKIRTLAGKQCTGHRLRVNDETGIKPHHMIKVGDILTFPKGSHVRVIKIVALATRRGPAPEAQALYEDLQPPVARKEKILSTVAAREPGAGRPTKADRRAIDRLKQDP
jgi:ribosome-associated heat shock protein Hsp15